MGASISSILLGVLAARCVSQAAGASTKKIAVMAAQTVSSTSMLVITKFSAAPSSIRFTPAKRPIVNDISGAARDPAFKIDAVMIRSSLISSARLFRAILT